MFWLIIFGALIITFTGIIKIKLELFLLRRKSDYLWVLLEREHLVLGELAMKLIDFLKFHDVKNTKPYLNVIVCQQHLKTVNTIWDKFQVYRTMLLTIRNLIDITKDYPECRSNNTYLQNVEDIRLLETKISELCKNYNYYTIKYNNTIGTFPVDIFSKILKIEEKKTI